MRKTKTNVVAILLSCLFVVGSFLLTACDSGTSTVEKKAYNVTYELNYDEQGSRVYPVQSGTTAPDWKPNRTGYRLDYWATDKSGSSR